MFKIIITTIVLLLISIILWALSNIYNNPMLTGIFIGSIFFTYSGLTFFAGGALTLYIYRMSKTDDLPYMNLVGGMLGSIGHEIFKTLPPMVRKELKTDNNDNTSDMIMPGTFDINNVPTIDLSEDNYNIPND